LLKKHKHVNLPAFKRKKKEINVMLSKVELKKYIK